jgi:hypothetical protein
VTVPRDEPMRPDGAADDELDEVDEAIIKALVTIITDRIRARRVAEQPTNAETDTRRRA